MLFKNLITVIAFFSMQSLFHNAYAASNFSLNTSPQISIDEISECEAANCLIELAKKEASKSVNDFEKDVAYEFIISSLFRSGRDKQALRLLNSMARKHSKARYLGQFRYITNYENDRFDTDDQFWQGVEVDMPSILVGHSELYDTYYAGWLVYKKEYEKAIELAKTIKNPDLRGYVYHRLAPALYKDDRLADAKSVSIHLGKTISNSLLIQQIFKKGKEQRVLDTFPEFSSSYELDNAKASFAILLAADGEIDLAVSEIKKIGDRDIRIAAYTNLLAELAYRNKFSIIENLLSSELSDLASMIDYRKTVVALLTHGKIDNAVRLAEIMHSPIKKFQVLSVIGAYTGDYKYFLAILKHHQETNRYPGNMELITVDMMYGGYLNEAVKFLGVITDVQKRLETRRYLFMSTFHSNKGPKNYTKLIEIFEDDITTERPYLKESILRYAANLMLVNLTKSREPLERFQAMANKIRGHKDREKAQAHIIPHYAYLGDFDKVYRIISNINHTYLRVRALTRLADFYTYGKMVKSN